MKTSSAPLIQVRDLRKAFGGHSGQPAVAALKGIDLDIYPGETLGLVGESGSGKSTLGRCILQLIQPTSGSVRYRDTELTGLSNRQMRPLRKALQIVFQDPFASLNPRMKIQEVLEEPFLIHERLSRGERERRIHELLDWVGLPHSALNRYPHQFSGGQRQRVGIARALAVRPEFIVCDEPISALDVSIQAQILNLLQDLQEQLGLTYLFIAHDLSAVRHISDRIAVLYRGEIVEEGAADSVCFEPAHPYTRTLLEAVPQHWMTLTRESR